MSSVTCWVSWRPFYKMPQLGFGDEKKSRLQNEKEFPVSEPIAACTLAGEVFRTFTVFVSVRGLGPRFLLLSRAGLLEYNPGSMMESMNLGFSEMIFIFFLALIIFGPKKLPEIGRQIGKALNEFKRASNEFKAQIESEINNLDADVRTPEILPPYRQSEDTVPSGTLVDAPDPLPVNSTSSMPEVQSKAAPDA